ncbi:MAG: hypothetical protein K5978_08460 [Campylobacter sp.]|nr:hypothetical protein [Campylobacter sp.]
MENLDLAKSQNTAKIADEICALIQGIELKKSRQDDSVDEWYYKETYGAFGGLMKFVGDGVKTVSGLCYYADIDDKSKNKFDELESKFDASLNAKDEFLSLLDKNDSKLKELINELEDSKIYKGMFLLSTGFSALEMLISSQNLSVMSCSSSKVGDMKRKLADLKIQAKELAQKAREYQNKFDKIIKFVENHIEKTA